MSIEEARDSVVIELFPSKQEARDYSEFRKLSDSELINLYNALEMQVLYYENADSFTQAEREKDELLYCVKKLDSLRNYVIKFKQELRIYI